MSNPIEPDSAFPIDGFISIALGLVIAAISLPILMLTGIILDKESAFGFAFAIGGISIIASVSIFTIYRRITYTKFIKTNKDMGK